MEGDFSFLKTYDEIKVQKGDFNDLKPKFQGKHEGLYENRWYHYLLFFLIILVMWGVLVGLWIGFLTFSVRYPSTYSWINFGVFILYLVIILFSTLFGSFKRRKMEKELINKKINEQNELKRKKILQDEAIKQKLKEIS